MIEIYQNLLEKYGTQGWWPISGIGYHKGDYSFPRIREERFEICCGAILTQNTNWKNAEKAIENLGKLTRFDVEVFLQLDIDKLKEAIRCSGYYNQKAERLKLFAKFFKELNERVPKRGELLDLKGIGFETADSILLYGYKIPIFVVDTYTKRFFKKKGILNGNENYEEIRERIEQNLVKDYRIFQEFHALIIEEEKNFI